MILGNVLSSFWVVCRKFFCRKDSVTNVEGFVFCWLFFFLSFLNTPPTIASFPDNCFYFKCSLPNLVHMHIFLHRYTQSLFYQCCILKGSAYFFSCSFRLLYSSEISPTSLASNITWHRKATTSLSRVNFCYLFSRHPFIHSMHCAGGWDYKCVEVRFCFSESW